MAQYKSLKQQLIPKEAAEILLALKRHKRDVKGLYSYTKWRSNVRTRENKLAKLKERLEIISDLIADLS